MEHNAKDGSPKLLHACGLPLTGVKVVNRVITDLAVFDIGEGGMRLIELADGVTADEVRARTQADYTSAL